MQWIPLVAGLGVGSVIGNWVGGSRARREVRAAMLERFIVVEQLRWVGPPDKTKSFGEFIIACHRLEAAALIARVPRAAVLHYLMFAHAARLCSKARFEQHSEDDDVDESITDGLGRAVQDAAETLTRLIWSPTISRAWLKRRIKAQTRNSIQRCTADDRTFIEKAKRTVINPSTAEAIE